MRFILTGDTPVRNTYKKHLALTRVRLAKATEDSSQGHSTAYDQLPRNMAQYLQSNEVLERCAAYEAQFRHNPPRGYRDFIKKDLRLCHDDLGAHNMLFAADGGLNVVDFELFGWNDPAYAVASMLCHNRMLDLPPDVHEEAISYYEATAPVPAYIVERVRPLLKLGHLEWIVRCIDSTRPRVIEKRSEDILGFDAERYTQFQIENIERHLATLDTLMKS